MCQAINKNYVCYLPTCLRFLPLGIFFDNSFFFHFCNLNACHIKAELNFTVVKAELS